jgi:exosortase family protein XrtF
MSYIQQAKALYLENPLVRFLARLIVFYVAFKILVRVLLPLNPELQQTFWIMPPLTHAYMVGSEWFFGLLGYGTRLLDYHTIQVWDETVNGVVLVAAPCIALEIMFLFAGIILAFPGSWKSKAWFIPTGIFTIFTLNQLRIFGLIFLSLYYVEYRDVSHKLWFQVIVYSAVFALFILYVQKFSLLEKKSEKIGKIQESV